MSWDGGLLSVCKDYTLPVLGPRLTAAPLLLQAMPHGADQANDVATVRTCAGQFLPLLISNMAATTVSPRTYYRWWFRR